MISKKMSEKFVLGISSRSLAFNMNELETAVVQFMSEERFPRTSGLYMLPPVQQFDKPGYIGRYKKEKNRYVKKNIKEKVTNWFRKKFGR